MNDEPPLINTPPPVAVEHAEVLTELEKLQTRKANWRTTLWVLLGSIALFLAIGATSWSWEITLWLIPVLFIHEAGHWVAMRIFKYRTLRMFFIPLFGAAVTGQHWNVPGWKKALVSLAGPLPGIFLGAVLAIAALIVQKPWLNHVAVIFLLLNGLNLLPILPLDGGRVLHATLFCRNRWLDFAFSVMAVLGLAVMGFLGFGKFMLFLAILMGMALPVTFMLGKVVSDLRKLSLPSPSASEDRIPTTTAVTIISELKRVLPRAANNKTIAEHTLNVFETLNARPPGVLATIGLLFLHAGGFLMAIVFGVLLIISQHGGGLGNFFRTAIHQPIHKYECSDYEQWNGQRVTTDAPTTMLVTTFPKTSRAATAFAGLTNRLPDSASLMRFGNSLLLSVPAHDDEAREKWFDELQAQSKEVSVVVSNRSLTGRFMFLAATPAAATNLATELQEYFDVATRLQLIPPWSPDANSAEYASKLKARRDWRKITREISDAATEVTRLFERKADLVERMRAEKLANMRTNTTLQIDPELFDLYAKMENLNYTNAAGRIELYRVLGEKLGNTAANDKDFSANYGVAKPHGALIEVNHLILNDAPTGLPAFADWICGQSCRQLRYEIGDGFAQFLDDLGVDEDEDVR